ncbi:MAG: cation-translocating P-type ATPase [Planctomycetia bacterium]
MSTDDRSPQAWHARDVAATAACLATDPARGLTEAEAARRLAASGPNEIEEPPGVPRWRRLARHFHQLVIGILVVAAVFAGMLGEWANAAAILAIVVLNGAIGFFQEERAWQALAALRRIAAPQARVVRDGCARVVPAREVVAGDLVELEAGGHVPADARLVVSHGLSVQEAALTGESLPVVKDAGARLPPELPLGDRATLVHAGTVVAAGRGAAIVVATGMGTELGRIAGLLERAPAEATPLQRHLDELGRVLVAVCLVIVTVIAGLELMRAGSVWDVLLRSVSLAVAAVPEGLPAVVTLVLAIGVQRMVARNALVRRLPSIETLGCVTVVGSDKTGTLTRNEMTVQAIVTGTGAYRVTGSGYAPQGAFLREPSGSGEGAGQACDPRGDGDLVRVLAIGSRCNNAALQPAADGGDRWQVIGDPTEGALLVAAMKAGIVPVDPAEPIVSELPFDSERKTMSVVVRARDGRFIVSTKGAPEAVLALCTHEARHGRPEPLTPERRAEILGCSADLAARALRVLGLAWRTDDDRRTPGGCAADVETDLVFAGLVGMIDPPRDEARAAVAICTAAGIRPVMITGDHPATAIAIARDIGLAGADDRVATGTDLDRWSDDELAAQADAITVYARVTAEHKLRIVRAWQRRGDVVAMTGDGVNDAPAIRAADIGIAMGLAGTDVAREASDMVLTDDNFASIVSAIEEGRGIYDNLQKFIHYLLACNAGEVLVMFVAALVGWPAPLAAIQILWLNLMTDGLPALAIGLESPEADLMRRRPRSPREPVLTWARGRMILAHGTLLATVTLAAFWAAYRGDPDRVPHARAVTFCVAAFSQLFFAFACRSDRQPAWTLGLASNPILLLAVVVAALLQVSVVMLPFARTVFEVGTELGGGWVLVLLVSLVPLAVVEVGKVFTARHEPARRPAATDGASRAGR